MKLPNKPYSLYLAIANCKFRIIMLSNIAENNYMFKDNNNRSTETTEAIEK